MTREEYMEYPVEDRLGFEARIARNLTRDQCQLLEEAASAIAALRERLAALSKK